LRFVQARAYTEQKTRKSGKGLLVQHFVPIVRLEDGAPRTGKVKVDGPWPNFRVDTNHVVADRHADDHARPDQSIIENELAHVGREGHSSGQLRTGGVAVND
jgi:hypothetical protein